MWPALSLVGVLLLQQTPEPTALSDALEPYRGQPVLSVQIDGPRGEDAAELLALIEIRPGYLVSSEQVQLAIKRLYAIGRFASVEVYAERIRGVVALRFVLRAIERLSHIELRGLSAIDDDALRAALHMAPGDEVDSRTPRRLEQAAVGHLSRLGFRDAHVRVTAIDAGVPGLVGYRLQIIEGPPTRVAQLDITGAPRVDATALLHAMGMRVGDILDLNRLAGDRDRLKALFVARGFLRVQVGEPVVIVQPGGARVQLPVIAGPRVQIALRGARVLTDNELWALWPGPTRQLARGDLQAFADRIERAYRRLGHAGVQVRLRGFSDRHAQMQRYLVEIEEGPPYRVASISFPGATAIAADTLVAQVRAGLRTDLEAPSVLERVRNVDAALLWREPTGPSTPPAPNRAKPPSRALEPDERWVPELYDAAVEEITAIYRSRGYLLAHVGPARAERDGDHWQVVVPVDEGPQCLVASVAFSGNVGMATSLLLDVIHDASAGRDNAARFAPTEPISPNGVEEARIGLIRHYRNHGFLYARVFADTNVHAGAQTADVLFRIEEGPQVRVGQVLIRGNRFTRTSMIRNRVSLTPGDLYRLEQAVDDQRLVAQLGVFSQVKVKLVDEERASEVKDLVVDVTERNRHAVEFAPGISTADGPRLRAAYAHNNVFDSALTFTASAKLNRQVFFNLLGDYEAQMQERYNAFLQFEQFTKAVERQVRVGIKSPPLYAVDLAPTLRVDLLDERRNAIPYSLQSDSLLLGLDWSLAQSLKLSLETQGSFTNLECVEQPGANQRCEDVQRNRRRRIDDGGRRTLKLSPLLTLDLRDNPLSPRAGLFALLRGTVAVGDAHKFGGFRFAKLEGSVTGYVPLHSRLILALSARTGLIFILKGAGAPIDERFYLGGSSSLRGFVENALLPADACVVSDAHPEAAPPGCKEIIGVAVERAAAGGGIVATPPVSTGGNSFTLLKAELRLRVLGNVFLDLFTDAGNMWSSTPEFADLTQQRIGIGGGLRYAAPVGAVVGEIAVNPFPKQYASSGEGVLYREPTWRVHFSVGAF